MRYTRAITLLSLTALLVAAPLAEARTPRPYVKGVTPLRASVGEQMTLQGYYFTPGYAENMVVLIARDGRVSYVRSEHSTKTRLTITVPSKVQRLLNVVNGKPVPTAFRVKVIARRMSRVAKGALSQPTIGPDVGGDCDNDGNPNPTDTDDDADLLPDTIEKTARTNPCVADSDGDRLLDGWEYMSAIDLNRNALPYPGKRPFPNALFSDANVDYDGDGLPAWAEHAMWWVGGHKYPLDYSDGDQTTVEGIGPGDTPWNDYFPRFGELSDDERDFDRDGLSNVIEASSFFFEPWAGYPGIIRPDFMDPDTDGDGILDGPDDQDHDDASNIDEFRKGVWAMNPCDRPDGVRGRTCPRWIVPGSEPKKPEHLCDSRSLMYDGPGVYNYEYDRPESPVLDPDEKDPFCKRPEDGLGL